MPLLDRTIRWIVMAFLLAPMCAADCCRNSVAVIASLSGSATAQSAGSHEKTSLSTLDWLSNGTTIDVGAASRVVLILVNGHRYELGEGARVTLTVQSVPEMKGPVRALSALPPIPAPAPIQAESAPTPGAPRFRSPPEMSGLYPRAGSAVLPDQVTLRFKAFPKARSYSVVLEDDNHHRLLSVTTQSTGVSVGSGTIEAGAHYRWQVEAMGPGGMIGAGVAEFSALSAENILYRTEFASALSSDGDNSATLALLAEVDRRLGLVAEACDEFTAALKQHPRDGTLRRALDSARAELADKR